MCKEIFADDPWKSRFLRKASEATITLSPRGAQPSCIGEVFVFEAAMPIKSLSMWGLIPWHGCIPSQPITFRWIPMRFGTHHKVVCGGRGWWLGGMGEQPTTPCAQPTKPGHCPWCLPHRPCQPCEVCRGRLTRLCGNTKSVLKKHPRESLLN